MSEPQTPARESIIVVSFNFDARPGHGSLKEDLVFALSGEGHDVNVLSLETRAGPHAIQSSNPRVQIHRVRAPSLLDAMPGILRRLVAQVLALGQATRMRRLLPDRVVYFSPAFLSLGPVLVLARNKPRPPVVVLVQWDFFPVHNYEIGRLPRSAPMRLLKRVERAAMGLADTVMVMSAKNAEFLHSYHPSIDAHLKVQPPWGGSASESFSDSGHDREERFVVVFGGQLTVGRGVEDLLRAAQLLERRDLPVEILVVGEGPDRDRLFRQAKSLALTKVQFVGIIPRADYLGLLGTASAGIAVTVPGVSIPSFPSKTVDYCRRGVPVVACTEDTSDYGSIIEARAGGIARTAGDAMGLAEAIEQLYQEWKEGTIGWRREAARQFFRESLASEVAAETVLAAQHTEPNHRVSQRYAKLVARFAFIRPWRKGGSSG